jgi:hypothetical protein
MSFDTSLSTDRDQVRVLIGDIVPTDELIEDDMIDALLTLKGSINGAALACAESLAARFSRDRDKKVGALSLSGNRGEFYANLVKQLRRAASLGAAPYCGGISVSDKAAAEADADRVVPAFTKNQFAHPGDMAENQEQS